MCYHMCYLLQYTKMWCFTKVFYNAPWWLCNSNLENEYTGSKLSTQQETFIVIIRNLKEYLNVLANAD